MPSLNLSVIQMDLSAGYDHNLRKAEQLVRTAKDQGSQLAVLPELFAWNWFPVEENSQLFQLAEDDQGPTLCQVQRWAAECRISLAAPLYERSGEHRFNTTYIISDTGTVLGKYRKNHIPYHPGWYERYYYQPGDLGFPVFHLAGLRIGVQTCWDNLLPEGSRVLGLLGTDVILAPRGTGRYTVGRWRTALLANALANGCYVATANRIGLEGDRYEFGGDSFIGDPQGEIAGSATEQDEVVTRTIDREAVVRARSEWPFFYDLRPEIYHAAGDTVGR